MLQTIPAHQRKKKSHSKSRLGCQTCKQRHVKCDEGKPSCLQCKRSGRQCLGYQEIIILTFPPSNATAQELRSTQFYHERVVSVVSGLFDGDFWMGLIAAAASSEPAVKYALVALSNVQEAVGDTCSSITNDSFHSKRLAWEYCNRSIKCLRLTTNPSVSILLVTSALFIFIEVLQGHLSNGMKHLQSAFRLLNEDSDETIDPRVLEFFESFLSDLLFVCGSQAHQAHNTQLLRFITLRKDVPLVLTTPNQTKQGLLQIFQRRPFRPPKAQLVRIVREERRALVEWSERIDMSGMSPDFQIATMAIKAAALVSLPLYHAYSAQKECVFDYYLTDLAGAQYLCEQIYGYESDNGRVGKASNWSRFRLIGHVLTGISLVCRDPNIRRRAISLIRKIYQPGRYGTTEIASTADVCQVIMEIEECGNDNIKSAADIVESSRVRLCSKTEPGSSGGSFVRWLKYPYVDDGPYEEAFIGPTTIIPDAVDPGSESETPLFARNVPSMACLSQFYLATYMAFWRTLTIDPSVNTLSLMLQATNYTLGFLTPGAQAEHDQHASDMIVQR